MESEYIYHCLYCNAILSEEEKDKHNCTAGKTAHVNKNGDVFLYNEKALEEFFKVYVLDKKVKVHVLDSTVKRYFDAEHPRDGTFTLVGTEPNTEVDE